MAVFGMVGMQVDDTLMLGTLAFSDREDTKLKEQELRAKGKQRLTQDNPIDFNGGILSMEGDSVYLRQKKQADKLAIVDSKWKTSNKTTCSNAPVVHI